MNFSALSESEWKIMERQWYNYFRLADYGCIRNSEYNKERAKKAARAIINSIRIIGRVKRVEGEE